MKKNTLTVIIVAIVLLIAVAIPVVLTNARTEDKPVEDQSCQMNDSENKGEKSTLLPPKSDSKTAGEDVVLKAKVVKKELEGCYYEVDGYRLSGEQDFSKYEGKIVEVVGKQDNSPSVYMTKAILVESITEVEDTNNAQNEADANKETEPSINQKQINKSDSDIKTDVAEYTGQVDPHSIEVKIIGNPEGKRLRVFQLSDEMIKNIQDIGLEEGDNIRFEYIKKDNGVLQIVKIEKK